MKRAFMQIEGITKAFMRTVWEGMEVNQSCMYA